MKKIAGAFVPAISKETTTNLEQMILINMDEKFRIERERRNAMIEECQKERASKFARRW